MAGRADVIHLLAEESESMKINVRTQCGPASTAMHLAAERGHDECIVALVACGARLDVVDRRCRTAKDVAMENGHWSVVLIIDLFGEAGREGRDSLGCSFCELCVLYSARVRTVVPRSYLWCICV